MKKTIIYILVFWMAASANSWAEDYSYEAELEKNNVSVGNPIYLYLTFRGSQKVDRPSISKIDGLQVQYVGPSTKIQVINGQVSRSITHTYLLLPLKKGEYTLGPFVANVGGVDYSTGAVTLSARDVPGPVTPGGGGIAPAPSARQSNPAREEPSAAYQDDRVFLTMDVEKQSVYVNEEIPLVIKLYVSNAGLREIQYPTFPHEGFSTGEYSEPIRRSEVKRGVSYEVLMFRMNLYAIKEGDYVLGPARLNCKMVTQKKTRRRASFFGRSIFDDDFFTSRFGVNTFPIELESNEIPMTILPFPEKGKPTDFQGATGDFSMEVFADPREVKVGDPIVLKMIITGTGNLDTVTAPEVSVGDKFKTYEPQVTKKDNRKIYEQILIPKNEKVEQIPEVSFSFFNTDTGRYETITRGPVPVKVIERPESERAVKMVSIGGEEQMLYPKEKLGQDIVYIKESLGGLDPKGEFIFSGWLFWVVQLAPLAAFVFFYAAHRRKERIQTDRGYARSLKAPRKARNGLSRANTYLKKGEILPFYDAIFKTLQEYIGNRFDLPRGNVSLTVVEKRLLSSDCDEEILQMLREVFSKCEMARYASAPPGGEEAEEMLSKVRKIIDYMEKVRI
ncbi:MAG: hypothetical protein GF409_04615 [Candidatus Omnitrophica bacterium]|nr:hypothetical protein [Candidatus Omnitrophota bacterium]